MNSITEIIKANIHKLEVGKTYSIPEFTELISPFFHGLINQSSQITFKIEFKKITINCK